MRVIIKNPAPLGPNLEKWGDYHFGRSLAAALSRRGVEVIQHYWPEWDKSEDADVVLVLRGKQSYRPPKDQVSLLWVISHPGTVSSEEIRSYHRVFVASETHFEMLRDSHANVRVMRQCTDTELFHPPATPSERRGIVFVANSRGVKRDIVRWGLESNCPPAIVGRHWKPIGLSHLVIREYIDNAELPDLYRSVRLSLNDHWGDMAHFGYINNRVFDCLACGSPILSDEFPELRQLCGDGLLYASDTQSYWRALQDYYVSYPDVLERTRALWARIGAKFTFDARVEQILDEIDRVDQGDAPAAARANTSELDWVGRQLLSLQERRNSVELFHVFPTPARTHSYFGIPGVSYLSAGVGRGPWHLVLDPPLVQVAVDRFDVIIIDDLESLLALGLERHRDFLVELGHRLRSQGLLFLPTAAPRNWLDGKFEPVGGQDGWALFRKT